MGQIKKQSPVKYFLAVTLGQQFDADAVLPLISEHFGEADLSSPWFDFDPFTNYYAAEMGAGLKKQFMGLKALQDPECLPDLKLKSNALEGQLAGADNDRTINIDPGYLTAAKVVLATTKDYSHRLYLGKGIFGDLHLTYSGKSYQCQAWTYPDYQQELSLNFFEQLRQLFLKQRT